MDVNLMNKSNKPPAFLLCENPMINKSDGRLFILHNRYPLLLAEVHHFQYLTDNHIINIQRQIRIGGRLDYHPETIFFTPVWIDKEITTQADADKIAGIFRRMADWYKSYLIRENRQH